MKPYLVWLLRAVPKNTMDWIGNVMAVGLGFAAIGGGIFGKEGGLRTVALFLAPVVVLVLKGILSAAVSSVEEYFVIEEKSSNLPSVRISGSKLAEGQAEKIVEALKR